MRNFLLDLAASLSWCLFAFFWPCWPCCPTGCLICEDLFDGDDEDPDTGSACGWTEDAGDFDRTSGTLRTSSSHAKLICDTAHPDAIPSHYVEVDLYGADGDELKVGVGDHYVQLTIGDPNGCLALYEAGGTLLSKMRVNAAASTNHLLEVWYGGAPADEGGDSQIVARLGSDLIRYNVTLDGDTVWLGTGSIGSTVRFDNFRFEKHYSEEDPDCNAPPPPDCDIFTDGFTRADSDDLGCSYDEISGDGDISGNNCVLQTSSTKIGIEVIHPQAASALKMSAEMSSSATDDQLRVYTDVDGNTYGQLTVGASKTLKLFIAGVEVDSVSLNTIAGNTYLVEAVQADGVVSVKANNVCLTKLNPNPAGPVRAGFGCGTRSGTITVYSVTLERGRDSQNLFCPRCCVEPCEPPCDTDTTPLRWIVEFDDVTSADDPAAEAAWNSTSFEIPTEAPCFWTDLGDLVITPCGVDNPGVDNVSLELAVQNSSPQIQLDVIGAGGGSGYAHFELASLPTTVCDVIDNLELPRTFGDEGGPGSANPFDFTCNLDFTNARAFVTALAA